MECTVLGRRRTVAVRLSGEVDNYAAAEARKSIERELKRTGAVNVALDFGNVTFMDSSGIGMIIGRYKTVSALGGRIILCGMSDRIKRLIRMAGIDNFAIIGDTLNDGIKQLNRKDQNI